MIEQSSMRKKRGRRLEETKDNRENIKKRPKAEHSSKESN
jgi:hypothetical protein